MQDGERKPRKRRRRRNGRPLEGAEGTNPQGATTAQGAPVQVVAKPSRSANPGDSFLPRIGRKIRRMLAGG